MFDIITVGSATVDSFIGTSSKNIKILHKAREEDVCFPIGSKILITYLHHDTGGGGTNSAVAFSRLGFKTGWLGKLGSGRGSRTVLEEMNKEKVKFLGKSSKGETGFSVIIIGLHKNRTILAYKGINDKFSKKDVNFNKLKTKWFYIGSMMGKSFKTAESIAMFAKKKKIKYAFNPSSYLAQKGLKYLKKIISGCDVLVLNKEEAKKILKSTKGINYLLKKLQKHARIVVITQGKLGASAYDGEYKYALYPRKVKVVETTGAGDSFASGFTAGIMLGKNISYSLQMGYAEASSVIGHVGAKKDLISRSKANSIIKKRPCRIKKVKI